MPQLRTMPLVQLLLHIDSDTSCPYPQSSIAQHTFQRSPSFISLNHSVQHIPFTSSISCHLRSQVLKQSTSSNGSPFCITCIRPPLPYVNHLITLLLPTLTVNFLLSHTLPTHSPVYTTSPSQPLMLYHLQITGD